MTLVAWRSLVVGALAGAALCWLCVAHAASPPLAVVRSLAPPSSALEVEATGTVEPCDALTLRAEVDGRIAEVSPALRDGGTFERDAVLARIDARDHELAVARARATLARARLALDLEHAEAGASLDEWRARHIDDPPPLVRREPQLAAASAGCEAASAELAAAERDLARTAIRAPYAGRVRAVRAALGQVVARGAAITDICSIEDAEVRLALEVADLACIELPLGKRAGDPEPALPDARVTAELGGATWEGRGRVVRTDGALDAATGALAIVVRVDDPNGAGADGGVPSRPPLLVGMRVRVAIAGRAAEDVLAVPAAALAAVDTVVVVDADDRLRRRAVGIVRRAGDTIFVPTDSLMAGDRPCTAPPAAWTDGMLVQVRGDDGPAAR